MVLEDKSGWLTVSAQRILVRYLAAVSKRCLFEDPTCRGRAAGSPAGDGQELVRVGEGLLILEEESTVGWQSTDWLGSAIAAVSSP